MVKVQTKAQQPIFSLNGAFAIMDMQQEVQASAFRTPRTYTSIRARHIETGIIIDVPQCDESLMKHIAFKADWDGKGDPLVGQNVTHGDKIVKLKYLGGKPSDGTGRLVVIELDNGNDFSTLFPYISRVDRLTQQQKSAIEDIEHYCQNGAFNQETADKMIELIKKESTKS